MAKEFISLPFTYFHTCIGSRVVSSMLQSIVFFCSFLSNDIMTILNGLVDLHTFTRKNGVASIHVNCESVVSI